jgi:pimeloyl-ACP methyl ester carboxylesterase
VFRIRAKDTKAGAPVAFCQHGLTSAANTWIVNEPEVAPAFQLARAGYDVWLGNNRGNQNSPLHSYLNQEDNPKEYFDYSFQELGTYDLPAQITLVLKRTGAKKLTYLGHS